MKQQKTASIVSTELFKDKNVPSFIKEHPLFRTPKPVHKVFPSIGLPNFKDQAALDKCLVDVKKEGSYVFNLLKTMADIVAASRDTVSVAADKLQYLDTKEAREANRGKLNEVYGLHNILQALQTCLDPYQKDVLTNTIHITDGKIELRLMKDIANNDGKILYRKDERVFKVFNKMKEKCNSLGVDFHAIETCDTFKIFSKENIPNKEFSIVFSSEGKDGAWDIATMAMRGIKSCQRWDGEYPRCLIGSILSRFVGVMYLTSGVASDDNAGYTNLGTKMMRRSVVRYAVDADEGKPCILIDKMYPDLDKDVLSLFVKSIKSRTDLPVYYAQELGNKMKHIYLPGEKIRDGISDRDWSYQDTPLKSRGELNVYVLTNNKEEVEREVRGFKLNLSLHIARSMESVYSGDTTSSSEVLKTINNIRMNTSFITFADALCTHILSVYRPPTSTAFSNSRVFYKRYLMQFLSNRKVVFSAAAPGLSTLIKQYTSRDVDMDAFQKYVSSIVVAFIKSEAIKIIN